MYPAPTPPPGTGRTNPMGLIALIVAIIGTITACIPGIVVLGWVLLPIAFILSIVALAQKEASNKFAVPALILSIVGTVLGVAVFIYTLVTAVDDAFSTDVSAAAPTQFADTTPTEAPTTPAEAAAKPATTGDGSSRTTPLPLGSTIATDDWSVTLNSASLNATDQVLAANTFNDPPAEGNVYLLVNVTVTYTGTDPQGDIFFGTIDYVTTEGTTVGAYDSFAVAPDSLDTLTTLYEGGATTGNLVFEVPAATAGDGVLAVTPALFADRTFVAVS